MTLRSGVCDHSDAYSFIEKVITIEGANDRDKHNGSLILKNNSP